MKKCTSYHTKQDRKYTYHPITGRPIGHNIEVGVCFGTREVDQCSCEGDMARCDFYPEVRERALKEQKKAETISGIPIDRGYLSDWYISSVNPDDEPVWTEEHLDELFNDFYLIPKEDGDETLDR